MSHIPISSTPELEANSPRTGGTGNGLFDNDYPEELRGENIVTDISGGGKNIG